MAEYKVIYKCRLCGERFEDGVTNENNAKMANIVLSIEDPAGIGRLGQKIYRHAHHYCKDGSFGFADFQGFGKVE